MAAFNNEVIFGAWEPGSIFKTVTLAAGIDAEKILPTTKYEDKGSLFIDKFTIKNADEKVYGWQDMTQVLAQSINTGAVFAVQKLGAELFTQYLEKFGFGEKTGLELPGEVSGDTSS